MNVTKESMLLYAVTDRSWLNGASLAQQVEECVRAGVTFVQLREKKLPFQEFVVLAAEIKKVTDRYQVPFVINDNIEVAKAVDADGVHLGQGDCSPQEARAVLGHSKIIGVSARTVEQAKKAQQDGADYLGVGAAFVTSTKEEAEKIPMERFREITSSVTIPVVAIGGIHPDNLLQLTGSGVDGVAVISAIFAQPDLTAATKELRKLSQTMVGV